MVSQIDKDIDIGISIRRIVSRYVAYLRDFMATIKDVARLAGVSVSTISKYLNGGNVLEENAESIRKAAAAYLRQMRIEGEVEFDLIAIDMFPDGSYDVRMINDIVQSGW